MDVIEIAKRIEALSLWEAAGRYNWLVKPKGTVLPYFFTLENTKDDKVRHRIHFLEGWNVFHSAVMARANRDFGYYTAIGEYPQFQVAYLDDSQILFRRCDAGYMPRELTGEEETLLGKLMWESYGIMLQLEDTPDLPCKYAPENAMFGRIESPEEGDWHDEGVPIPQPPPYTERVSLRKDAIEKAKAMGIDAQLKVEVDYRLMPGWSTAEARPRAMYLLAAVDASSGRPLVVARTSVSKDVGLKQLWEKMPALLFGEFVKSGRFPCEIIVNSQRMFRFLRIFCEAVPVKLSIHDQCPVLDAFMKRAF